MNMMALSSPDVHSIRSRFQECDMKSLAERDRLDISVRRKLLYRSPIIPPGISSGPVRRSLSGSSLSLNFHYERTMTFEETILSSSSEGTDDLNIPQYLLSYRQRSQKIKNDFSKYLPAPFSSLSMPRILPNKKDKKEWTEAQEALNQTAPTTSMSDSFLDGGSPIRRKTTPSLLKIGSCCVTAHGEDDLDATGADLTTFNYDLPKIIPRSSDPRFSFENNVAYCKLASDPEVEFSAVLYAEIPAKPNLYLCHVQTELAVAGMLSFFHPYTDVQLLWIQDLRGHVADLMSTGKYMAKFTELVYLKRFDAAIVVSHQAGKLMRHSKLAFLHALAAALKTNASRLLVLCQKPQELFSTCV